jgi:hypothetical protein
VHLDCRYAGGRISDSNYYRNRVCRPRATGRFRQLRTRRTTCCGASLTDGPGAWTGNQVSSGCSGMKDPETVPRCVWRCLRRRGYAVSGTWAAPAGRLRTGNGRDAPEWLRLRLFWVVSAQGFSEIALRKSDGRDFGLPRQTRPPRRPSACRLAQRRTGARQSPRPPRQRQARPGFSAQGFAEDALRKSDRRILGSAGRYVLPVPGSLDRR